jgi:hypothetical protein
MSYQGRWEHWSEGKGWTLRIGPLFKGEISYTYRRDRYGYSCSLNGADLGFFPKLEDARQRVEWEVWNQLRLSADGLRAFSASSGFQTIGLVL